LQVADPSAEVSDAQFDRQWALTVMARALETIAAEFRTEGRLEQFNLLKPWLAGDTAELDQARVAAQLGMGESAVKVAIHRLRKRFREAIRTEVAQTVPADADVDEELRYLVEVLAATA
jgi:RNA polymerase sigma-70 factor (ECF subfamily)